VHPPPSGDGNRKKGDEGDSLQTKSVIQSFALPPGEKEHVSNPTRAKVSDVHRGSGTGEAAAGGYNDIVTSHPHRITESQNVRCWKGPLWVI